MRLRSFLPHPMYLLVTGLLLLCVLLSWQLYRLSGTNARAQAIATECKNKVYPVRCVVDRISAMIAADGDSSGAMKVVRQLSETQDWMGGDCSVVATRIGNKLYQTRSDHSFLRFGPESVYCNYAFLQEYVRALLLATKDKDAAKAYCARVRSALNTVSASAGAECYRAVGQTVLFIDDASQGKPSEMIKYAIRSCEEMAEADDERIHCVSGAFNYLDVKESVGAYGLSADRSDPAGICREQTEEYRPYCYGNFKRVILASIGKGKDFGGRVSDFLRLYPGIDAETLNTAVHTLGYDAGSAAGSHPDYSGLVDSCKTLTNTDMQRLCVEGVGLGFAKNGTPGDQYHEIKKWCDAAADAGMEHQCPGQNALSYLEGIYAPEKFVIACRLLEMEADPLCK